MDRHQKPRERELYDRRKTSENFSINQLQIDIITKTEYLDKNLFYGGQGECVYYSIPSRYYFRIRGRRQYF